MVHVWDIRTQLYAVLCDMLLRLYANLLLRWFVVVLCFVLVRFFVRCC